MKRALLGLAALVFWACTAFGQTPQSLRATYAGDLALLLDSAKVGAAKMQALHDAAYNVGTALTAQEKAQAVANIAGAYPASVQTFEKLKSHDVVLLVDGLRLLGAYPSAALTSFAEKSTAWKSWPVEDIAWLAKSLGSYAREASKAGRGLLAEHVLPVLSDEKAAWAVGYERFYDLTVFASGEFSQDKRTQWVDHWAPMFVGGVEDIEKLGVMKLREIFFAFQAVKQSRGEELFTAFVSKSTVWQSWGALDIAWLGRIVPDSTDAGNAARLALADQLDKLCFSSSEALQSLGIPNANVVANSIREALAEGRKQAWAELLVSTFSGRLDSASAENVLLLCDSVYMLTGNGPCAEVGINFVTNCSSWRNWTGKQLIGLSDVLAKAPEKGKEARATLTQYILSKAK